MGLNDDIDEGLIESNPFAAAATDPTKVKPQVFTELKMPSEFKMDKLDKIIATSSPQEDYTPPTKEELFGSNIQKGEIPQTQFKVKVFDELTKLNDLKYGSSVLHEKGSISQEDVRVLDNIYKGSLINDQNLIGFYTKHASKSQYAQTLRQLNDLINQKSFILSENYNAYLTSTKESLQSFQNALSTNYRVLDGFVRLIDSYKTSLLPQLLKSEPCAELLRTPVTEVQSSELDLNDAVKAKFEEFKERLQLTQRFFRAFLDLYYKKPITAINAKDIKAYLYYEDSRYSVLDVTQFICEQLRDVQSVVQRSTDKSILNIDTIKSNFINCDSDASKKMHCIESSQSTIDSIELDLSVYEQVLLQAIEVCKSVSLLFGCMELQCQENEESSMESIVDDVKHFVLQTVSDEDKLIKNIYAKVESSGSKNEVDTIIKKPVWAKDFGYFKRPTVDAKMVINSVNNLAKTINSPEYAQSIQVFTSIYLELSKILQGSLSSGEDQAVQELTEKSQNYADTVHSVLDNLSVPKDEKLESDFKPISREDAAKLLDALDNLTDNTSVEKKLSSLENAVSTYRQALRSADTTKFYERAPKIVRQTRVVEKTINEAVQDIYKIFKMRKRMIYASSLYIQASFK